LTKKKLKKLEPLPGTDEEDDDVNEEDVDHGPEPPISNTDDNEDDDDHVADAKTDAAMMITWKKTTVDDSWPRKLGESKLSKAAKNVEALKGLDRKGTEKLLGELVKQVLFDPFLVELREHWKRDRGGFERSKSSFTQI